MHMDQIFPPQTVNSVDPVAMMKHSMSGISDEQVGCVSNSVHIG